MSKLDEYYDLRKKMMYCESEKHDCAACGVCARVEELHAELSDELGEDNF